MKINRNFLIFLLLIFALSTISCTFVYEGGDKSTLESSIGLLNIVATLMAVLVALLTLIFIIAIAFGFFESRRWVEYRKQLENRVVDAETKVKEIEEDAKFIKNIRKNLEEDASRIRMELGTTPLPPLTEKPSEEIIGKLDELSHKLEILEALGVSLKPEDYLNRGFDLYNKGKYKLALEAFDKAIELKPDYAEAWNNKGWALSALGRNEEALKAYDKAIELKPDFALAWSNKGVRLGKLSRYEEALKAYDKAIELKPDDATAWSNKGAALVSLNRHNEALKAFDKAIELKLDFADTWFNRACAYSLKKDKENTLKNLSKAIQLDITYKEKAKKDEDFKNLREDEDFKKIVQ